MDLDQALQNAVISLQTKTTGASPTISDGNTPTDGNGIVLEMFNISDVIPTKDVSGKASEIYQWALERTGSEIKALSQLKKIKHRLGSQATLDKMYRYIRLRSEVSDKIGRLQAMEE